MEIRLQKYFSDCGILSRRAAEKAILDGLVEVNGKKAELGTKIDPEKDRIVYGGRVVRRTYEEYSYYMLNKPRGFITSLSDEKGRKCIADLITSIPERVYPVGRLDYNSEGLLLLTNDGALANTLMHPSHGVTKTYIVVADGCLTNDDSERLSQPVVSDGEKLKARSVSLVSVGDKRSVLAVELSEGKNREIRRIFEACGIPVHRLKRVAIGKIELGSLKKGDVRPLSEEETAYLKKLQKKENKSPANS